MMDVGTSTLISINTISGTGPYTAQLEAEAPGATKYSIIASTNQFSTLPEKISTGTLTSTGQWHFVVDVTEVSNTGIFGTSSPVTITVVNAPTASALSISPTTTDVGSPVSLSIQPGYGTAPFQYVWAVTTFSGGLASGDYTTSGNQITFTLSGTYSVTVTVNDADGLNASISLSITVNSQLSVTISATTPTTIDKGQTVTFTNSVTGGLPPYSISYSVSSLSGGITFGGYFINGNVITFTLTGQYTVTSTVTDSLKNSASSTNSATVTVNPLPSITLSPSSMTIDSGNSVTFTNTTSGGTAPYTFIWSFPASQGITPSGNTFTFADTGNFTVTLTIVDAVGVVASASSNVTVNPSPVIVLQPDISHGGASAVTPETALTLGFTLEEQKKTSTGGSDPINLDENTPWSAYVRAGTGTPPYTFNWTVQSINGSSKAIYTLASSNSSYVDNVITFTGTGNYTVTIKVVDKYGDTSSTVVNINVNPPLLVVSATVQASPSSFDLGNSTTLVSVPTISGGTPTYYYQWYRNGTSSSDKISGESGPVTSVPLTLSLTPAVAGNYTYYLVITDSAFSAASSSTSVNVSVNNLPTTASIMISPTSTVVDGLINATVKSGYGTSPYNYTWTITPQNSSLSSFERYGHQIGLSNSGNYTVSLKVRDADGKVAYNNTTVKIYSSSLVIVKISSPATSPTIDAGQPQSFTGSYSGGSGTYEYQWVKQNTSASSPPSSGYITQSSPQTHTFYFNTTGTFYVFLYVKDTVVGDTQSAYEEVTVNNDISSGSISISPTTTNIGNPVTASVTYGYGTSPYTYTWSVTLEGGGSAAGDYSTSGNQLTFSKSGNYTVSATVKDSFSQATSSNYNVEVTAVISLTASISSYPSSGITALDVNHAQVFQATVTGGSGSYSYSWGISGVSGTVGTSSSYTLNVSNPGLYKIYLNVSQGTSTTSASPITVVVNPLPKVSFQVAGTIETDVGQTIYGNVAGGTTPYQYSWLVTLYPSGNSASGDYTISGSSITFTTEGNYSVKFMVTDARGVTASITSTFIVNYQLSSSLSLSNPLSSVINRGNSSVLNVSVNGGTGTFSYQWFQQLPGTSSFVMIPGATNATYDFLTSSATTPGIYLFYVNVTDTKTDPAYVHSNILSVTVLAKVIYGVSFTETGLPTGAKWFLNISGGYSYTSSSANLSFLEPNGTYYYSISTSNKSFNPYSENVTAYTTGRKTSGCDISVPFTTNIPVISEDGLKDLLLVEML